MDMTIPPLIIEILLELNPLKSEILVRRLAIGLGVVLGTHGSFPIRHRRGHPGAVLQLVISKSANRSEGMQLELSPI